MAEALFQAVVIQPQRRFTLPLQMHGGLEGFLPIASVFHFSCMSLGPATSLCFPLASLKSDNRFAVPTRRAQKGMSKTNLVSSKSPHAGFVACPFAN